MKRKMSSTYPYRTKWNSHFYFFMALQNIDYTKSCQLMEMKIVVFEENSRKLKTFISKLKFVSILLFISPNSLVQYARQNLTIIIMIYSWFFKRAILQWKLIFYALWCHQFAIYCSLINFEGWGLITWKIIRRLKSIFNS